MQGPNHCSASIHPQPHAHMKTSTHICISLPLYKGIKETFKERHKDWLGACRVPLLGTGGPGQIKNCPGLSACLVTRLPCLRTVLGHLKNPLEEPRATRWIRKEVILQWCESPGWLGTQVHVYVCELKLKGQFKWARQFCKWCRGPVYIECTFTGDLGCLKKLNEWDKRRNRTNSPQGGEMKEMD